MSPQEKVEKLNKNAPCYIHWRYEGLSPHPAEFIEGNFEKYILTIGGKEIPHLDGAGLGVGDLEEFAKDEVEEGSYDNVPKLTENGLVE